MFKKKEDPATDLFDIAPWLEEPVKRIERLARHTALAKEKEHLRKVAIADQVREAYRHTKELRAKEKEEKEKEENG